MFFVQINHTGKGFLFLIFREIKLRKYSSLHKLFYSLCYLKVHEVSNFLKVDFYELEKMCALKKLALDYLYEDRKRHITEYLF